MAEGSKGGALLARVLLVVSALAAPAAPAVAQSPQLDTVLRLAARYLDMFVEQFSRVVAEEHYVQESSWTNRNAVARRALKSDFLMARPSEAADWIPFRDVFEIDGKPVRDRQDRLAALFLKPSDDAINQAQAISEESARFNLGGNLRRTINNPLLSLVFLQSGTQGRFHFSLERKDSSVGPQSWIVSYQEEARPTVLRGSFDKDLRAQGRFWIDADSGRVRKSELKAADLGVAAVVTTTFRMDDRFQIDVPAEMVEQYILSSGNIIKGTATYGRFRRFDVTADQDIAVPK